MDFVLLVSRWVHISAAIVAIGGAAYAVIAVLPTLRELSEDVRVRIADAVRSRWARVVHVCIVLLLLTGGLNFYLLALAPGVEPMPYHAIFLLKLLAALAIFFIASALVGRSPGFAAMRAASRRWLTTILALAAAIVLLSGVLSQVRQAQRATQAPPANTTTNAGTLQGGAGGG